MLSQAFDPGAAEPPGAPAQTSRAARAALFAALCALAFAGNVFNVPLFFGVGFVFGSIAALLAAFWMGALPGMAVAAAGGLSTLWLWGHPYGLLIFVAEAGAVGLTLRHLSLHGEPPPLALADGLFWLFLGIPLTLLLLHGPAQMPWLQTGLIALKASTNGLLNAALAGVVVILTKRLRQRHARASLREVLFSTLLPAVLVPTYALTVLQNGAARVQMEAGVSSTLALSAALAQDALEEQAPPPDARTLPADDPGVRFSDARLQAVTTRIRQLVPAALGVSIAVVDAAGNTLAGAPPSAPGAMTVLDLHAGLHLRMPRREVQRGLAQWRVGEYFMDQPLAAAAPGARLLVMLRAEPGILGLQRTIGTQLLVLALIWLTATLGVYHLSRRIALRNASERRRIEAERDTVARALRRYNADLVGFSDLMAGYLPPHEQIRALLEFACRSLGARAAALGEIQGANYRLLTSVGAAGNGLGPVLAPGVVLALGPAEQDGIRDLERSGEAAPDQGPQAPQPCALPPRSGFTAAALIRWTDAEGQAHQGALSFAPGQGVAAATTEKLQVIQLVGQGIASGLREWAVLDGLLAARQREIIGHLASGVAHDFNNLLGVVDINLDYLADLLGTRGLPPEVAEVLEETRLAARHAQMVTAGLVSLSRGRRPATGPTPVSSVVERFTRTLARLLPAQIEVETRIAPDLVALADEALLQSALLNLCINARDAMGGRGTLGIGLTRIALTTARPLTLGRLEPGDYVELAVSDTGVGMSAEVLGQIFQPLFSTKSSGRGTGLGLFMVREFTDRCGGGVAVETKPGRGSRFLVYLPVAAAAPAPGSALPAPAPMRPARVLLVDDDPGTRTVLCRILEHHGLQVDQAGDGAEALVLLGRGCPCDLVLSDIVMPRMDGIELHRRLARTAPNLPVILMTADDHQSVQAAGLPVDTVILYKPLVTEILLSRIQERLPRRG